MLEGDWVVNAGVLGLTVLAVGGAVAGLAALFGRAGAAFGALLMVLVGNPLSGVSSAPELLPQPAGAIGQLLPPGAGGSLLRSTAFFDGAGGTVLLAVLAAWVVLGLLLTWMAAMRRLRPSQAVAPEADPVPVPWDSCMYPPPHAAPGPGDPWGPARALRRRRVRGLLWRGGPRRRSPGRSSGASGRARPASTSSSDRPAASRPARGSS